MQLNHQMCMLCTAHTFVIADLEILILYRLHHYNFKEYKGLALQYQIFILGQNPSEELSKKVKQIIWMNQRSNSDDKGPIGQETTCIHNE